jgi:hypothetical protein
MMMMMMITMTRRSAIFLCSLRATGEDQDGRYCGLLVALWLQDTSYRTVLSPLTMLTFTNVCIAQLSSAQLSSGSAESIQFTSPVETKSNSEYAVITQRRGFIKFSFS